MLTREQIDNHLYRTSVDGERFLSLRIAYDGNGNPEYLGLAVPGTLGSESGWQIRQIAYDVSQNPTAILFAESQATFDRVWDDRVTYTYG